MLRLCAVAALAASSFMVPVNASAQAVSDVHFEAGNYGATISGTIIGNEYIDYRLTAGQGQDMTIDLQVSDTNGYGVIYFNLLPPGSTAEAIYNSSMDSNAKTVTLPEKGTYTIRVYLMGNDRDSGATVGFNMDVSIK